MSLYVGSSQKKSLESSSYSSAQITKEVSSETSSSACSSFKDAKVKKAKDVNKDIQSFYNRMLKLKSSESEWREFHSSSKLKAIFIIPSTYINEKRERYKKKGGEPVVLCKDIALGTYYFEKMKSLSRDYDIVLITPENAVDCAKQLFYLAEKKGMKNKASFVEIHSHGSYRHITFNKEQKEKDSYNGYFVADLGSYYADPKKRDRFKGCEEEIVRTANMVTDAVAAVTCSKGSVMIMCCNSADESLNDNHFLNPAQRFSIQKSLQQKEVIVYGCDEPHLSHQIKIVTSVPYQLGIEEEFKGFVEIVGYRGGKKIAALKK